MKKRFLSLIVITMMLVCSLAVLGGWAKPKMICKAVNINDFMVKWKASNNWVFEQTEKFTGTCKETNIKREWTQKTIIERNGNTISRISQDGGGSEHLSLSVYDGGHYTYYFGRYSCLGWDLSCMHPNASQQVGEIENYFDTENNLRFFAESLKLTKTLGREENGVYCFENKYNMGDIVSNEYFKANEKFIIIRHFKCSIKFGTSTIRSPIIIKDGGKEYIKDLYSSSRGSAIATNVSTQLLMPQQTDSQNKDELIITLLTPEIQKAVAEYYGENRMFEIGDSHVRIIKRGEGQYWNIFRVEVKVDTFEGPHNNYFTEFLIFRITPSEITLEDYRHSDFTPNN